MDFLAFVPEKDFLQQLMLNLTHTDNVSKTLPHPVAEIEQSIQPLIKSGLAADESPN